MHHSLKWCRGSQKALKEGATIAYSYDLTTLPSNSRESLAFMAILCHLNTIFYFSDYEPPTRGSGGDGGHGFLGNAINVIPVPDNGHRNSIITQKDTDDIHDIDNRPPMPPLVRNNSMPVDAGLRSSFHCFYCRSNLGLQRQMAQSK